MKVTALFRPWPGADESQPAHEGVEGPGEHKPEDEPNNQGKGQERQEEEGNPPEGTGDELHVRPATLLGPGTFQHLIDGLAEAVIR